MTAKKQEEEKIIPFKKQRELIEVLIHEIVYFIFKKKKTKDLSTLIVTFVIQIYLKGNTSHLSLTFPAIIQY